MEIISPRAMEYLRYPGPVHDPDDYAPEQPLSLPAVEWQIVLRAAGSDNVLARYARELGATVTRTLEGAREEQYWRWISHFEQSVLARHRNAMVMYTHLAIQSVGPALQAMERAAPDYNLIPAAVGRAVTGNLFFVPAASLLDSLAAGPGAAPQATPQPPADVDATPLSPARRGSLAIGSLKGNPQ
jgi:hypothetical protein